MKAQSNSKSGYRNIFYNDAKRFYTVHICRNGRRFIVYTDTKEEAIEVRDKSSYVLRRTWSVAEKIRSRSETTTSKDSYESSI